MTHPLPEVRAAVDAYVELRRQIEAGESTWLDLAQLFTDDAVYVDPAWGRVEGIERQFPGVRGDGIKLAKGRRYRLSGRYDNRTGRMISDGAMVHMVLLFVPDDPRRWPAVDRTSADWRAELADLEKLTPSGGHRHE